MASTTLIWLVTVSADVAVTSTAAEVVPPPPQPVISKTVATAIRRDNLGVLGRMLMMSPSKIHNLG